MTAIPKVNTPLYINHNNWCIIQQEHVASNNSRHCLQCTMDAVTQYTSCSPDIRSVNGSLV